MPPDYPPLAGNQSIKMASAGQPDPHGAQWRLSAGHRWQSDLGNIQNFHFRTGIFGGIAHHGHAEGAAESQHIGAGGLCFVEAVDLDAFGAVFFFFPNLSAAGAAAEGFIAVARHFGDLAAGVFKDSSRLGLDVIVAAQIAWIVIGDRLFLGCRGELQFARVRQLLN